MGSDANRRQWAVSHIEGLYFLGKGGILAITNQCNPVLSVRPDGSNRLHRLNIGRLAPRCPVAVSDGSSVGCVYLAYGAGHAQNLFLAEGFNLVFTNT